MEILKIGFSVAVLYFVCIFASEPSRNWRFSVRGFLDRFVTEPDPPEGLSGEIWDRITDRADRQGQGGGRLIGFFDALISFVAFYISAYSIIAGWLAFKVATK